MLILIDGNAMGHAHHNATTLTTGDFQTQAIYGFVRMLRDLTERQKGARILVLWDGTAQHRLDLFDGYKAQRAEVLKTDPEALARRIAYRKQVPYIKKATELLGVDQMMNERREADDLAGYFVKRLTGPITLTTGDGDWKQLVRPNVAWFDPRKDGRWVTHETFQQTTGYFTPEEFLQGKALMGDTSDSIPGIDGLGEKRAAELLAKYRSVDAFFAAWDRGEIKSSAKYIANLVSPAGRAIYARNLVLMDLLNPLEPDRALNRLTRGAYNPDQLRRLFERLGFVSLLNQWGAWTSPFATRTSAPQAALATA